MKKLLVFFLFLSSVCLSVMNAQTRMVTGKVFDDTGEPLAGAFVQIVGTTDGTSTDVDGHFILENVPSKAVLRVSYIGFDTIELPADKDYIEFEMKMNSLQINEVVVTGMQQMDKRMFTGATDNLKADEVLVSGIGEISRGLEGRSAGVSVQNISGTFGAAPKIRIRGATSIYGDSKPLWVVDGVIMEDVVNVDANSLSSGDATTLISSAIAGLNSDDIESFNILKDGSATSIYGARAMAGVIVVTTKKGTAGQVRVNYSGEFTVRLVPTYSEFNIMNSQDQMGVYEEMYRKGWLNYSNIVYASQGGVYQKLSQLINTYNPETGRFMVENTEAGRIRYLQQAETRNTDWFKELFRNSVMNNHSVSISAGTEKGTYYASIGALVDPGWTLQSKVNRYTALFNASQRLFKDHVTLNLIGNASYRTQRAPGSLSSEVDAVFGTVKRDFDINPYSYALRSSRTLDPDEFYTRNYAPFNIKHELANNYMDINVADIKVQAELKYHPVPKVELAVLGSVRYQATSTEHNILDNANQAEAYRADYTSMITSSNPYLYANPDLPNSIKYSVLPNGGIYTRNDYRALSQDFRATVNYNDTFRGKHVLNAFGVVEINSMDRESTSFQGWGLQYDMGETPFYILDIFKKQIEDNIRYYGMSNTRERNAAFAGTVSYSYDYRYTINGTLRYEGSNRLGRSRSARWLPTWNIAGKWAVDQENFFDKLRPALSTMNLRASYSLTADRGPAWVNNSTVTIYSGTPWRGSTDIMEPAMSVSAPENSELTYEKKHEFNFGFDLGFIDNRISLSLDAYKRNNFDLIGNVITSGLGGFVNKMGNVAEMTSSGVELSLSTRNIQTKDFSWSTSLIFAHMDNRVTKLNTSLRTIDYLTGSGYSMEGYPRGSMFSFKFKGLDEMGIPTFEDLDGNITSTDLYFQETKNFSNLKYEGPSDPTITGSFGNIFRYKGFTLNVFMTYSFGNVVRLDPIFSNSYSDLTAMPKEFQNRFVNPGDEKITNVPVIASKRQNNQISNLYVAYSAYNYSDVRIAKGDFIRMKEISLSYDFPKHLVSSILLNGLSLKVQATNPFLIYSDRKLQGQDPEFFNSGGVAVPMPKQFTLTCKITF